mmetsp:Transcript_38162/g.106260  ORF Transcript_38162/g.106260 Transcript_38162/m.106260 type:complete len:203 (+) Transcript_38162:1159-1767(+)
MVLPYLEPDQLPHAHGVRVECLAGQDAILHKHTGIASAHHQPEKRSHEGGKNEDCCPEHPTVSCRLTVRVGIPREPLQGQGNRALHPSLLRTDEVSRGLGHTERQLPVHKMRMPAHQDLVQATCGVLNLATGVELFPLDELIPPAAVIVAHTLAPFLPDGAVVVPWGNKPHTVGAAGGHATTTVPNHSIQPEEGSVVVVHVV